MRPPFSCTLRYEPTFSVRRIPEIDSAAFGEFSGTAQHIHPEAPLVRNFRQVLQGNSAHLRDFCRIGVLQ
jgi:hypothetical protein